MLVVLVVLGLMVGLVVARGPSRSTALEMRAAVGAVTQDLRLTRARAIAGNTRLVVGFDPGRHQYQPQGATPRPLPIELELSVTSAAGQKKSEISFAPDGSSSGGRLVFVEGGRRRVVEVSWLTGRVSVTDAE